MLKPVPMAKVTLVGPKDLLGTTVDTVHDLGLLHIEDYVPGEAGFDLGSPLAGGSQASERLLRIRGILKAAQMAPPETRPRFTAENLRGLQSKLEEVEEELGHLVERRNKLLDEEKALDEQEALLSRVQNFLLPLNLLQGYATIATAVGFVPPNTDLEPVRSIHPDVEIETSNETEGALLFAAVPKAAERALQERLTKLGFQPLDLPPANATPAARLAQIHDERARAQAHKAEIESKIAAIRERHGAAFYALDESLSIEADKATSPVRFRTTRNAFMIEGWVPRDALTRLRYAVDERTKNRVFVTELPTAVTQPWKHKAAHGHAAPAHGEGAPAHAAPAEAPPVALRNPRGANNYMLLTDTYSRPKYSELDPTLFFFVGFPLFYGVMLGDIAYGALLLLLVWTGVFNKVFDFFGFQSKQELNRIFTHCALSSIAFGFLYAEFFGLELWGHAGVLSHASGHLGPIPWPLGRFVEVKLLLFLSLLIAAVHMLIGLALGLRNSANDHGWGQAIKHRGSWFLIMVAAAIALVVGLPGVLSSGETVDEHGEHVTDTMAAFVVEETTPFFAVAGVLFLVGLVLLVAGEGGIALLELPTVLSNLLSYTRLVAIGLSSAGIALAGNKVSLLAFGPGGVVGIIAGILILLFFHGLNLALGVIGPALHSLRLHYVEFFTKFYEGGGEPYAPFSAQRQYTVKEVKQA